MSFSDESVKLPRLAYTVHAVASHVALTVPKMLVVRKRSLISTHYGSKAGVRQWGEGFMSTLNGANETRTHVRDEKVFDLLWSAPVSDRR